MRPLRIRIKVPTTVSIQCNKRDLSTDIYGSYRKCWAPLLRYIYRGLMRRGLSTDKICANWCRLFSADPTPVNVLPEQIPESCTRYDRFSSSVLFDWGCFCTQMYGIVSNISKTNLPLLYPWHKQTTSIKVMNSQGYKIYTTAHQN